MPRRDEDTPADYQFREHQGPYLLGQLTGGRGDTTFRGLGLAPFTEVRNARRSVDELFERFHELDGERRVVKRSGLKYQQEDEWKRLDAAREKVQELNAELRGMKRVGGKLVPATPPSAERRQQIHTLQLEAARKALGGK